MATENARRSIPRPSRTSTTPEKQLLKALPKMAKAADDPKLAQGFEMHADETEGHVERFERTFEIPGKPAMRQDLRRRSSASSRKRSRSMEDFKGARANDAGSSLPARPPSTTRSPATARCKAWAQQLGMSEAVKLLDQTLKEEKATDQKLTDLALSQENAKAANSEGRDAWICGTASHFVTGRARHRSRLRLWRWHRPTPMSSSPPAPPTKSKLSPKRSSISAGALLAVAADMSPNRHDAALFAAHQAHVARLDIVVANAGINGGWAPIDELKPKEWDETIRINLRGTYLTAASRRAADGQGRLARRHRSSINGTRTFTTAGASATRPPRPASSPW